MVLGSPWHMAGSLRCAVAVALLSTAAAAPVVLVALEGVAVDGCAMGSPRMPSSVTHAVEKAGWAAGGVQHERADHAPGHAFHTLISTGNSEAQPSGTSGEAPQLWKTAHSLGLTTAVVSWPRTEPHGVPQEVPAPNPKHPAAWADSLAALQGLFAKGTASAPHITAVHLRGEPLPGHVLATSVADRLASAMSAVGTAVANDTNVLIVGVPSDAHACPKCAPGRTAAGSNCDVCLCNAYGKWGCRRGKCAEAAKLGDACHVDVPPESQIASVQGTTDCPPGAACRQGASGWTCQEVVERGALGLLAARGPSFRAGVVAEAAFGAPDVYALVKGLLGVPGTGGAEPGDLILPFSPLLQRSPTRARWGYASAKDSPYGDEWYPQQDGITIYPPTGNYSQGTRFDLAVVTPVNMAGGAAGDRPEVAVQPVGMHRKPAGDDSNDVAALCSGAVDVVDATSGGADGPRSGYMQYVYRLCEIRADWQGARVTVTAGCRVASVTYQHLSLRGKGAKNVVLVIGDGMSLPMITATRLLTRGRLPVDDYDYNGLAFTKALDSIVTDSAAAASALNTGHKTFNGGLGVYPDAAQSTAASAADNPRVETFAEYVRRTKGMKVGVVTTASVVDATPAGVWAHHARRDAGAVIAQQALAFQPDVLLGGGADVCNASQFTAAGYTSVTTAAALANATASEKLLGLFAPKHLHTANDRRADPSNTQPSLPAMATAALDVLHRGPDDHFYLMVEAASIDKQAHSCDSARMLGDSLELQETLVVLEEELARRGILDETLIVVTSDHATGGYDVYGTVNTYGVRSIGPITDFNAEIEMYGRAEWPDWVAKDFRVENWDTAQWTFAGVNNNHPDYKEDFRAKHWLKEGWIGREEDRGALSGIALANNLGETPHFEAVNAAVHTTSDVMVFAKGRGSDLFAGSYENTHIFHGMLAALAERAVDPALGEIHEAIASMQGSVKRLAELTGVHGQGLIKAVEDSWTTAEAAAVLAGLQRELDAQVLLLQQGGTAHGAFPSAHHVPLMDLALAFGVLCALVTYLCTGFWATLFASLLPVCPPLRWAAHWWTRRGQSAAPVHSAPDEATGLATSSQTTHRRSGTTAYGGV